MRLQSHSTGRTLFRSHDGRNGIEPSVSSFVQLQDNLARMQADWLLEKVFVEALCWALFGTKFAYSGLLTTEVESPRRTVSSPIVQREREMATKRIVLQTEWCRGV